MSELGELLELLHGARSRFRTARGVLRSRHSSRLMHEAMKRENARKRRGRGGSGSLVMFSTGGDGAEEPPDLVEDRIRFWLEPPEGCAKR